MATLRLLLIPALFFVLATSSMAASNVTNLLFSSECLCVGQYLAYGEAYELVMQEDCNLVMFEYRVAVWSTRTGDHGRNCYLAMQEDGNLVLYTAQGSSLWSATIPRVKGTYVLIL